MSDYKIWLDGHAIEGAGQITVINPATEKAFATIARSDQALVDKAVAAAISAQKLWSAVPIAEKQAVLLALADGINARAEELSRVLTMEQGKPLAESSAEVAYTEAFIRHFATFDLPVEVLQDDAEKYVELHREPLGVVACIIPWNFPAADHLVQGAAGTAGG